VSALKERIFSPSFYEKCRDAGQTIRVLKSAMDYIGITPRMMRRAERRWRDAERHQRPLRFNRHAVRLRLRQMQWAFIENQYAYMEATKDEREYLFSSMGVPRHIYEGASS